jgi:histidine ammonia-lyase
MSAADSMARPRLELRPGAASLHDLRRLHTGSCTVELVGDWRRDVERAVEAIAARLRDGATIYGVNTGFGLLASVRIAPDQLESLQLAIVRSHAAGTGDMLPPHVVRLVLALKAASLARGHSGVRTVVVERLLEFLNADILPCIPAQGSVGASGDLAPLAHMSLALVGEGEVEYRGARRPALAALQEARIEPLSLRAKEGLALLNGTQVSTALALSGMFAAEDLCAASLITGAMSVEAVLGSHAPFRAPIHAVRGHRAQIDVAAAFRLLLEGSQIVASHAGCDRVQDPYSLRCQPQVAGACLQQLRHAAEDLLVEANAVTDNPLIFVEDGSVVSGGNFHAEPVALAADTMALALAEIGALAERRVALLMDAPLSRLPPFLVRDSGLNSGFMLAQVTAAALASENKSYAHPASVDSLPTSANQEDHVSMATFAARRLAPMAENVRGILAIELLAAAQGLEFRRPLRSSETIERAHALLRRRVGFYERDRYFAPDIAAAREVIADPEFIALLPTELSSSRRRAA